MTFGVVVAVQLTCLLFGALLIYSNYRSLVKQSDAHLTSSALLINNLEQVSLGNMQKMTDAISEKAEIAHIFLFDENGQSFDNTGLKFLPISDLPDMRAGPRFLKVTPNKKKDLSQQLAPTRYFQYYVAPFTVQEKNTPIRGYALIQSSRIAISQQIANQILLAAGTSLALMLLAYLGISLLTRRWTRPLQNLTEIIGKTLKNDQEKFSFDTLRNDLLSKCSFALSHQDELADLVQEILHMAERLHLRDQELEKFRQSLELKVADRTKKLLDAKDRAEAANRAKSTFLAQMSHELRTPLNGILGMAQALQRVDLKPIERGQLDVILSSGELLLAVLSDILDLSKIEANKLELNEVKSEVLSTLERTYHLWIPTAQSKELELSFNADKLEIDKAIFDNFRVQQCLSNLLSNALKFTEKGGVTIEVSSHAVEHSVRKTHQVQVAITDTGSGMDTKTVEKLFKPFAQADASTSRSYGGTGLGLLITKKFAELMEGDLTISSKPGEGSRFVLTFSVSEIDYHASLSNQASDEQNPKAVNQTEYKGKKLLLVDDNSVNLAVARVFLDAMGFDTTEASNGEDALALARSQPFDLILLDIHMPILDGPATYLKLRHEPSANRNTPVIALTANAMAGDRQKYTKGLGMDGYIAKPINSAELENEIHTVMARSNTDEVEPRLLSNCL